jgi:hypothetical protein
MNPANIFRLSYSKCRHPNHRIGAHACANRTVPYGTALFGGPVQGTSCQATIAPSLRDEIRLGNGLGLGEASRRGADFISLGPRTNVFVPSIVLVIELELELDGAIERSKFCLS